MKSKPEITHQNLRRIAGLNGLTVDELCRQIRRHKTTVFKAVRFPHQFRPTYSLITSALPIRTVKRKEAHG